MIAILAALLSLQEAAPPPASYSPDFAVVHRNYVTLEMVSHCVDYGYAPDSDAVAEFARETARYANSKFIDQATFNLLRDEARRRYINEVQEAAGEGDDELLTAMYESMCEALAGVRPELLSKP